jgi:hypothetical protein
VSLPKHETRITVPTGGWSVLVTEIPAAIVSVTVAAGNYYLGGVAGLAATLEAALNASALVGTYTVTVDDNADTSLGKVTIASSGITSFIAGFTSTALQDALGFATGLSPTAASHVSGGQSPYLWLPNTGRAATSPDITTAGQTMGRPEYDYTVALAPSGATARAVYETRYRDSLEYSQVKGLKAWTILETTTNGSFQTWLSALMTAGGVPFRYHPDRSSDTVYSDLVFDDAVELRASPVVPGWAGANSLWTVGPYGVRKLV